MSLPLLPHLRRLLFAVLLAAMPLVLYAAPASAAGPSANLACTITFTSDINPPITPAGGHHSSTTKGLTGTANCTGTVDGQTVTGTGSFRLNSEGTGDCVSGSGKGTFALRVPTTGGTKTVTGRFAYFYGPGLTGGFTGDLTGSAAPVATVGDCVTTPLSHSTSQFVGTVST
jgi:hypothetical protein